MVFAILGTAMVAASVILLRQGTGLTFYGAEWDWILNRDDWTASALLDPHNEHLSLVPILLFKFLFATAGLDSYWAFRGLLVLLHLLCTALLFALVRRTSGNVLALFSAVVFLFLGHAWQALLWPFQAGYLVAIASGLGMMLALDRTTLRWDAAACVLLLVSVASASIGIPFAVVAGIELAARRSRPRRLWVVLVPVSLYGLWFVLYGDATTSLGSEAGLGVLFRANGPAVPAYIANSAAGAIGAIIGLGVEWGRPLALLGLLAVAIRFGRGQQVSARLVAVLAAAIVTWGLTALFRAHWNAPTDSVYLYFGAVLVLLIASELVGSKPVTPTACVMIGALLLGSVVANYAALRDGARTLHEASDYLAAELGALEVAGPTMEPAFRPDPMRAPDVSAGKYFDAIERHGSPADTPEAIKRRGEPQRQAADRVVLQALRVVLRPVDSAPSRAPRPKIDAVVSGLLAFRPRCVTIQPTGPGAVLDLTAPPSGLTIENGGDSPVEARIRRFASTFSEPAVGTVAPRSAAVLRLPARSGTEPWHVRLTPAEPVTACGRGNY